MKPGKNCSACSKASCRLDIALILADQILALLRQSGVSKMEAHAALSIAGQVLPTIDAVSFRNDLADGLREQRPAE